MEECVQKTLGEMLSDRGYTTIEEFPDFSLVGVALEQKESLQNFGIELVFWGSTDGLTTDLLEEEEIDSIGNGVPQRRSILVVHLSRKLGVDGLRKSLIPAFKNCDHLPDRVLLVFRDKITKPAQLELTESLPWDQSHIEYWNAVHLTRNLTHSLLWVVHRRIWSQEVKAYLQKTGQRLQQLKWALPHKYPILYYGFPPGAIIGVTRRFSPGPEEILRIITEDETPEKK